MRKLIFILSIVTVIIYSCNTNSPTPTPPAGKGAITISDITTSAYTDETITITGTGFNPDMMKDTVDFGGFVDNADETDTVFMPATILFQPNAKANYIVTSATSTQLVIKAFNADSLYNGLFTNKFGNLSASTTRYFINFRVRSGGAFAISKRMSILGNPALNNNPQTIYFVDNGGSYSAYEYAGLVPGDTTLLTLYGLYNYDICGLKLQLNCGEPCSFIGPYLGKNLSFTGTVCSCDSWTTVSGCNSPSGPGSAVFSKILEYDKYNGSVKIAFVMPQKFFGVEYVKYAASPDQYLSTYIKARVVNGDGKISKSYIMKSYVFPFHE